jgi:hypothetical protein
MVAVLAIPVAVTVVSTIGLGGGWIPDTTAKATQRRRRRRPDHRHGSSGDVTTGMQEAPAVAFINPPAKNAFMG